MPSLKRFAVVLSGLLVALFIGIVITLCLFLPRSNDFLLDVERFLSHKTGYQITVGNIEGRWVGIAPTITLNNVHILKHKEILVLDQITTMLSWKSLLALEPRFAGIHIQIPQITIKRNPQSIWFINGLPVQLRQNSPLINWLSKQGQINIPHTTIRWEDEKNQQSILFKQVALRYDNNLTERLLQISVGNIPNVGEGLSFEAIWADGTFSPVWSGYLRCQAKKLKLGNRTAYLDKSSLKTAQGKFDLQAKVQRGKLAALSLLFDLKNIKWGSHKTSLSRIIKTARGKFFLKHQEDQSYKIKAYLSDFLLEKTLLLSKATLRGSFTPQEQSFQMAANILRIIGWDLLKNYLTEFGFTAIANIKIEGNFSNVLSGLRKTSTQPVDFFFETDFTKFNWHFENLLAKNIHGHLFVNKKGGNAILDQQKSSLKIPRYFNQVLHFEKMSASLRWEKKNQKNHFFVDALNIRNKNLTGKLWGYYKSPSNIKIQAQLDQIKANHLKDYLPKTIPEKLRKWFDGALKGGVIDQLKFSLNNNPRYLFFQNQKSSQLDIEARFSNVKLRYHPSWPLLDQIHGELLLKNQMLKINTQKAFAGKVALNDFTITIPHIKKNPIILAKANAYSHVEHYLRFTEKMPNHPRMTQWLKKLHATGKAPLNVSLNIPLKKPNKQFTANLFLQDNSLTFDDLPIPRFNQIRGNIKIDEKGLHSQNIRAKALGGPWHIKANVNPQKVQSIDLKGKVNNQAIAKHYLNFLSPYIQGTSNYAIAIKLNPLLQNISIVSDCLGARFLLPTPLDKKETEKWPLQVSIDRSKKDGWIINYRIANKDLKGALSINQQGVIQNSLLQVGKIKNIKPTPRISFYISLPKLSVDNWIAAFKGFGKGFPKKQALYPLIINVNSTQLNVFKTTLHDVKAHLQSTKSSRWVGEIASKEIATKFTIVKNSEYLKAHLTQFHLSSLSLLNKLFRESRNKFNVIQSISKIDLQIDSLYHNTIRFGSVNLKAKNDQKNWRIEQLKVVNEHASAKLQWKKSNSTSSQLTLHLKNIGNFLANFGYKKIIEGGSGSLTGNITLKNQLLEWDLGRIEGNFHLDLRQGRLLQLDPGSAKLLNLLSLRSLLQFAQFDFDSIFAEGLFFDRITGNINVKEGIVSTQTLMIHSPIAKIIVKGHINLNKNTQQLWVRMEPAFSESLAITAGLVALNPMIGLATFVGQNTLNNPVEKILAIEYQISGSISEPVVEKGPIVQDYLNAH